MSIELCETYYLTSIQKLRILAGYGIGGVAIPLDLNYSNEGIWMPYRQVATIEVNGKRVWINHDLPDAPPDAKKGRQDVDEFGIVVIELLIFKSRLDELNQLLDNHQEIISELGLTISKTNPSEIYPDIDHARSF